ncbi:hypothetical protein ACFQL8_19490 [Streptomyces goshikiensis]|uniref:hypothetical protein n=1 Tax=Streptomyces goshikiensis TaxID=1942 RepID=UPI001677A511|nr:hypothetical protein [Streptomyces goshikiensis]GHD79518.1 hypothetical protein GCM10010336_61700 [Streptomyces goshikiensis]
MSDDLLFDVSAPPTPVERLLALAGDFTQHNDAFVLLLPALAADDLQVLADSAKHLARESLAAVQAVEDQRLYASVALIEATVRTKQLAYLSSAVARHLSEAGAQLTGTTPTQTEPPAALEGVRDQIQLAQELTLLAPAAAVEAASGVAREVHRRQPSGTPAAAGPLAAAELTALHAAALGLVVMARGMGREYVHSRDHGVRIGTLRSLENKELIAIAPNSAPPAYEGGPPQDRIRLTCGGTTAVAALLVHSQSSTFSARHARSPRHNSTFTTPLTHTSGPPTPNPPPAGCRCASCRSGTAGPRRAHTYSAEVTAGVSLTRTGIRALSAAYATRPTRPSGPGLQPHISTRILTRAP